VREVRGDGFFELHRELARSAGIPPRGGERKEEQAAEER
jgi:hypothetical protein